MSCVSFAACWQETPLTNELAPSTQPHAGVALRHGVATWSRKPSVEDGRLPAPGDIDGPTEQLQYCLGMHPMGAVKIVCRPSCSTSRSRCCCAGTGSGCTPPRPARTSPWSRCWRFGQARQSSMTSSPCSRSRARPSSMACNASGEWPCQSCTSAMTRSAWRVR